MEDDAVGRCDETVHWTHRLTRGVRAVHARHRDRSFAGLAVVDRDDTPSIDAPRNFMLVLAGGDASIALDATVAVAEKFHAGHL
jgi:hypothetical protein